MAERDFYSLVELKEAANAALEEAQKQSGSIGGAINWGDLSCTEARYSINERGEKFWTVIIEEASPDACDLHAFVMRYLHDRGFHGIEVVTEW